MESADGFGERIRKRVTRFWKRESSGVTPVTPGSEPAAPALPSRPAEIAAPSKTLTSVQILRQSLDELNLQLSRLQADSKEQQLKILRLTTAREAAETSKAWYRAVAQEVPVGYLVTDRDGVVREANLAAGRFFGASPEVLKGKPFWSLVAEDEREAVRRIMDRLDHGHSVTRWIARVRPAQGAEARACSWTMSPLRGGDGFAVLFEEISDVLAERDALRRRGALIDHADEAIIELGRDGTVVGWNPAAKLLYAGAEALGRPLLDLVPSTDRDRVRPLIERLRQGESVGHFETAQRRSEGQTRHLSWRMAPLRDEDGRPAGGAVRVADVTERHLDTERQQRERQRIRSLVAERALADERSRRRVAHELEQGLQQSLNVARMKLAGLSQIIGGCSLDEPVKAACKLIDEALGSIEHAAFSLSPPVLHDLGFVPGVRWLADDMRRQHGLVVQVEDDGRDKLLDEPHRVLLFEALRELLANVARHAETPAARLQMHLDGDKLVLRVRDAGVGFDASEVEEGPGLLATREQLAHLGGELELRSTPGQGTTATIQVPLSQQRPIEAGREAS